MHIKPEKNPSNISPDGVIVTIHRGSQQIGGTCVEITHGGQSLVLDAGLPLDGVVPSRPPVFQGKLAAVLLSHAHLDHWGLLREIPDEVPIYGSQGTSSLLNEVVPVFFPDPPPHRIHMIDSSRPFVCAGFTITPIAVDHAAPDALAFIIEAGGRRLFYSGDLRGHGRTSWRFERLLDQPPLNIDALLLEGTTLGRQTVPEYPDEDAVEEGFVQVFQTKRNLSIVFASAQNLDRMVSLFRATKHTHKTLILDPYAAFVLDRLSCLSPSLPQMQWDGIRVLCWRDHMKKLTRHGWGDFARRCVSRRIAILDLGEQASDFVLLGRAVMVDKVLGALHNRRDVRFIWSQWDGYLKQPKMAGLTELAISLDSPITVIHASGHATPDDLGRMVKAIRPRMLIPIHTERPDAYKRLGMAPTLVHDGQSMEII